MFSVQFWIVPKEADFKTKNFRISQREFQGVAFILFAALALVLLDVARPCFGTGSSESTSTPAATVPHRMTCTAPSPDIWPVSGPVSSDFGYRQSPFRRRQGFHEGVDIASPRGTPIVATASGVVAYAGYQRGFGKMVIVDHGFGVSSLYGHASRLFVRKGQWIEEGDVIARVGTTGHSTGPHLHYEIHVDGIAIDPVRYMSHPIVGFDSPHQEVSL